MKAKDWIKVTDMLPPFGKQVLVCHKDGTTFLAEITLNESVWSGDGFLIPIKNTSHWMNIVKPRKCEKENLSIEELKKEIGL